VPSRISPASLQRPCPSARGDRPGIDELDAKVVAAGMVRDFSLSRRSRRSPWTTWSSSRRPGAHAVGVLLGEVLDGTRGAAVGVAFAQHRVHGGALDLVVLGLDAPFPRRRRERRGSRARRSPGLQLSDRASFSCGTEAEMLGSLMMLASGLSVSAPSSRGGHLALLRRGRRSGKTARMRPAREMSRVSTLMSACLVNAWTIGRNE
jgi:hypothetical protein